MRGTPSQETVDAVKSGFVTYSFEAAPAHCKETYDNLVKENLRVHQVHLEGCEDRRALTIR